MRFQPVPTCLAAVGFGEKLFSALASTSAQSYAGLTATVQVSHLVPVLAPPNL